MPTSDFFEAIEEVQIVKSLVEFLARRQEINSNRFLRRRVGRTKTPLAQRASKVRRRWTPRRRAKRKPLLSEKALPFLTSRKY